MKRSIGFSFAVGLCVFAVGCGNDLLQPRGKLLRGGQPLVPEAGEVIQITFVPIRADGKPPADYYFAETDQTKATFRPAGKNGKGMPPGKYRVAVEIVKKKKDILNGMFDADKTPFVFDVDATTKEIVIDLDKPG